MSDSDALFAQVMAQWQQYSTAEATEQLLRQVIDLRQSVLPLDDPRVARAQDQLGRVFFNRGVNNFGAANFDEAERWFRTAADAQAQHDQGRSLLLADYLGDIGAAVREQGRLEEATVFVCRSLDIRHALAPNDRQRVAASLLNLARIASAAGRSMESSHYAALSDQLLAGIADASEIAAGILARECRAAVMM